MEQFLNAWKPKELKQMSKDERADLLAANLKRILDFHQKKGHRKQSEAELNVLFDKMAEKTFPKTVAHMLKIYEGTPDLRLVTLMVKFLERRHKNLDNDVIELYSNIIDGLLKQPIKVLMKKGKIDDYVARELLAIVPEPKSVGGQRFVGIYVGQIARRLYALAKGDVEQQPVYDEETGEVLLDDEGNPRYQEVTLPPPTLEIDSLKQLRKIFATLFGKEMLPEVATSILLERKEFSRNFNAEQLRMWKLLTIFALTELESLEKKDLTAALDSYITRRTRESMMDRDSARRIVFDQVSEEEFPRIMKVVKHFREKNQGQFL